ncbi:putative ATP-dependent RNA helicase DDX10 [Cryptotermes secundus]|uniref:ATP-dependent RNA helicase n=2 Tax=Cryptotermes secundus TaxID=105785 RepID=A0A2J7RNQ1_9NEOP|nr:probable ATP-dependent RNA helicase DDX10 [Cryptotermes secundus]PNF42448.1 putative ATP-dependent RNA helicase DDX10 [Cryptotermes secundus]
MDGNSEGLDRKQTYKKSKRKKKITWNKSKNNKLKSEVASIQSLKEAYNNIDASKVNSFKDFPLSQKTLKGLKECGYVKPTEIQQQSIGLSLWGLDILGAAKTGSGKTLAFLIPVLEALYCKQWTRLDGIGALIITPTRELAYQIFETLRKVGYYHDMSAGLIIGGKDLHFEKKRMDKCNILICTPGRLLQHMDENPLFDCSNMQILVLDEADRCLDLGFEATMNNIIENLPPERQTLLFSATQTKSVRDLARLSLKDPMYVSVHEHAKHSTPESLRQSYIICNLHDKINMLWSFIRNHLKQKILVFMASCKQVKYVYEMFCHLRPGTTLLALYGTLHQLRRMAIYESFCRKSNAVLFATDIAARGLDFPEVDWVVQLDCPEDANTYIHRAGRTARYHKGGESLLVLLPSEEQCMVEELNAKKIPVSKIKINPMKLQSPLRKMEAFLARDPSLKESAQRAFVSYVKSIFLMKNKKIFNIHALDTELYSRSLGLAVPPRIRFLQRAQKQRGQQITKPENLGKDSDLWVLPSSDALNSQKFRNTSSSESSDEESNQKQGTRLTQQSLAFGNDDSDSELDVLKVKRRDHELEMEIPSPEENFHQNAKKKVLTKVAMAKKILKKKIIANKKTLFNDEGQAVLDHAKEKVSDLAREYESQIRGGIDIEEAKQVLREEDKYDKQRFRDKIKAKHREEKVKLKKARHEQKKQEKSESEEDFDNEEDAEEGHLDLSWLPDPDKVYPLRDMGAEDSDRNELSHAGRGSDGDGDDYDSDDDDDGDGDSCLEEEDKNHMFQPSKRKRFREDEPLDTGLSLQEDEDLAVHLLRNAR